MVSERIIFLNFLKMEHKMHLINRFQNHVTFHRNISLIFLLHLVLDIWEGTFRNRLAIFTSVYMVSPTIQVRWLTEWHPSLLEDRFSGGLESHLHLLQPFMFTHILRIGCEFRRKCRIWLPFRSEDRACREFSLQIFKGVLAFYTWFNTFEQYPICRSAFCIFLLTWEEFIILRIDLKLSCHE